MKFIKDIFTLANGEDFDIGRIVGFAGAVTFIYLSIFAVVVKGQAFDPQAWGMGFGLLITGIGAALMLKHKTEPQ